MVEPDEAARRLTTWAPLRVLTDFAAVVADTWRLAGENHATLTELRSIMADTSPLLNEVAADMARLAPAIADLVAANTRLSARVEELTGEDVAETAAAENVRTQWDGIASKFAAAPDVPDVEPLPEPPADTPTDV